MSAIRVRMLRSQAGSEDGTTVRYFRKGEEYEITPDLAQVFLREKWAVHRGARQPPENQSEGTAPETK